MNKKLSLVGCVFTILLILLVLRIIWLKTVHGEEYTASALSQNMIDKTVPSVRGSIYDSNGNVLAASVPVYDVILEPIILAEADETTDGKASENTVGVLSEILDIQKSELNSYLEKNGDGSLKYDTYYLPVAKDVPLSTAEKIQDASLTGVWLEQKEDRVYPFGVSACHVVGFKRGMNSFGLENSYDSFLSGKDGRMVRQYDGGTAETKYYPPQNGCSVISTIDMNIQRFAEEGVAEAMAEFPCETAAVLVMDPCSGALLACAASNVFDPNEPSIPVSYDSNEFDSLDGEDQSKILNGLWNNYNISSTFEPGSIFKPLLVCGALDEGLVTEESVFDCPGYRDIADRRIHCIRRSGHGTLSLEESIAYSCNCAMMDIAGAEGAELFYKYQRDFGFGYKTGVDLPFESGASTLLYSADRLGPVELATSSIGQSFNCTPIQALTAFSSIANGGQIMRPYCVDSVIDGDGLTVFKNEPESIRTVMSEDTCAIMNDYLLSVVEYGTGKKAAVAGYEIAGKSGTGEQGDRAQDEYTITFIGYFPADDPKAAMLVVIDKPEEYADGVTTAAPVFGRTAEKILEYMGAEPETDDSPTAVMPDLTNFSPEDAVSELEAFSIGAKVIGEGSKVTSQFPAAGEEIAEGSSVLLYLK